MKTPAFEKIGHAVDVLRSGQMVADLVLVGLEVLGKRTEHQAAMDGAIGVDRLDLRNQVFLRNVLGQNELLDLDADELGSSRCALFIGQVGGVLAAADDGQLRETPFSFSAATRA